MQTIHPLKRTASQGGARRVLRAVPSTMLLPALSAALSLIVASPSWAQDPPAQPAPVPGAGQAATQGSMSGTGATTGAGSDPISATTMMRATGTPATSGSSTGSGKKDKKNKSKKAKGGSIEPWFGRRVLLLLPLQVGPGFNADPAFGKAILSRAEAQLQTELEATGKFSVIRAHRFSPLIQRALQEKRLTADEAENVIEGTPPGADPSTTADEPITVEGANTFLKRFAFDQLPMIAQFSLEEVRSSSVKGREGVQAQIAGRLYEAGNPVALKAPVLTSDTVSRGRNNIDRYLEAARMAFGSVAGEFVAPLEDVALPQSSSMMSEGAGSSNTNTMGSTPPASTPTPPAPDTSMGTAPDTGTAPDMGTTPATAPAMDAGTAPATGDAGAAPAAGGAVAPGVAPGTGAPAAGG